jgi:hypothetical protein
MAGSRRWPDPAAIFLTFVGTDEGDEISGAAGDVAYHAKEGTITGTLRYHQGDDLPFVLKRAAPEGGAKRPAREVKKRRHGKGRPAFVPPSNRWLWRIPNGYRSA